MGSFQLGELRQSSEKTNDVWLRAQLDRTVLAALMHAPETWTLQKQGGNGISVA